MADYVLRNGTLHTPHGAFDCRIGRAGLTANKREGDLMTPIGSFPLRWCYFRPDRFKTPPETRLPLLEITENDGWCDDAAHPLYNQPVSLPFEARHEKLWREDALYDLVIPLGYNDDPVMPGRGSAIFLHMQRPDGVGTEGCLALTRDDLLALLPHLSTQTVIVVEPQ